MGRGRYTSTLAGIALPAIDGKYIDWNWVLAILSSGVRFPVALRYIHKQKGITMVLSYLLIQQLGEKAEEFAVNEATSDFMAMEEPDFDRIRADGVFIIPEIKFVHGYPTDSELMHEFGIEERDIGDAAFYFEHFFESSYKEQMTELLLGKGIDLR